jgi:hypothetical protein
VSGKGDLCRETLKEGGKESAGPRSYKDLPISDRVQTICISMASVGLSVPEVFGKAQRVAGCHLALMGP